MSLDVAAGSSLMGRCAYEGRAMIEKMVVNQTSWSEPSQGLYQVAQSSVETVPSQTKAVETRGGKRTSSSVLPDKDFIIMEMSEDREIPIILRRPLIATAQANINEENCDFIDELNELTSLENSLTLQFLEEISENDSLVLGQLEDSNERSDSSPVPIESIKRAKRDRESKSIVRDELNKLPEHLKYVFLGLDETYPLIISTSLVLDQEAQLISILKRRKTKFAWKILDIKGINQEVCMHHIRLEAEAKPCRQPQRRLNENMQEVVKKEVLLKKGDFAEQTSDDGQVFMTRLVTGLRVCINYKRLNEAMKKDHFLLPFLNQCLEKLSVHEYYCFLDGYSSYHQIPIKPENCEKTTFTCPYGTFTYRRMPFGLCNAPTTSQRCMSHIFSDILDFCIEVFMDDFSVYGKTILLTGIEVDRSKVSVIEKMSAPSNEKEVRIFFGNASFHRGFIKDFSKIIQPLTVLLCKDAKFEWSSECEEAFLILKEKLTTAPIISAPVWSKPFELMTDASDYAVGDSFLVNRARLKPYVWISSAKRSHKDQCFRSPTPPEAYYKRRNVLELAKDWSELRKLKVVEFQKFIPEFPEDYLKFEYTDKIDQRYPVSD
ncbi:uncharacterized protein LOC127247355 [Andrographis paniculata]|uniref:uncharacterized protein LOC127247355 n=1 Tax=Andrographis paniculata TaxID=175694 RepID=UPI0021E8026C|nr:uncharacterized protein LOC127247355 [Andrographis paniculata]